MIDPGLRGKVAVVTGANNPMGIGAATAQALAAQGVAVFLHYFRQPLARGGASSQAEADPDLSGEALYRALQTRTADEVVQAIRTSGGRAEAWEADLGNPDIILELLDRAEAAFGPVQVLVNNAALSEPDTFLPASQLGPDSRAVDGFPMRTISSKTHDLHFAVNTRAPALLMAEFARRLIERDLSWGRIINISTDGASGFVSEISYGASKHALESFSRAAAAELGRYGITVNVLSLGPIQTGWITPEMEKEISEHTPLGRVGQPGDVADVIVFLASEQARWVTGQLIYVGGGHAMPL